MKRFSERLGLVESTPVLQTEGMNDPLRNSIWNFILSAYESRYDYWIPVAKWIAQFLRKTPVDELPYRNHECQKWVREYFFSLPWYGVYDFVEFIVDNHQNILQVPSYNRARVQI